MRCSFHGPGFSRSNLHNNFRWRCGWYHENKNLKEFVLLIQGNSETIKNEGKEQKGGTFGMLLST